jgi:uncharacterized protein YggE
VHGISFSVAEPNALLDQARQKAMADARRKAELYAKAENATVGRVMLIEEATPHIPRPMYLGRAAVADGVNASVPLAQGELDFNASITVTYELGHRTQ